MVAGSEHAFDHIAPPCSTWLSKQFDFDACLRYHFVDRFWKEVAVLRPSVPIDRRRRECLCGGCNQALLPHYDFPDSEPRNRHSKPPLPPMTQEELEAFWRALDEPNHEED